MFTTTPEELNKAMRKHVHTEPAPVFVAESGPNRRQRRHPIEPGVQPQRGVPVIRLTLVGIRRKRAAGKMLDPSPWETGTGVGSAGRATSIRQFERLFREENNARGGHAGRDILAETCGDYDSPGVFAPAA